MARFTLTLAVIMLACRPGPIGPEDDAGDEVSDEAESSGPDLPPPPDLPPTPDLPCGGADLMNDDLNCGSCGHECYIQDNGYYREEWNDGGHCKEGKCGPVWATCYGPGDGSTCRELLEKENPEFQCATGCNAMTPGTTALYFDLHEAGIGAQCWINDATPDEYTLGCDDPLPWNPDPSFAQSIQCCVAQLE